jgi:aldose 1-epimerase
MESKLAGLALLTALWVLPGRAAAVEAARSSFGAVLDGRPVEAITLTNRRGVSVRIITLGAALQSLLIPDRRGASADVVLGFAKASAYLANPQYFGATVGRFANRIAKGRFVLDGKSYELATNDGPNSLHGGLVGFDKVIWAIDGVAQGPTASVTLKYVSPDGDQGYPGTLAVTATYSLNEHDELSIEYRAMTDRTTLVNISNHSYFNLAGEGAAEGVMHHLLMLPAQEYTPVDKTLIPTGEFRSVAGTAFDFREPKAIGRDIRNGLDEQLVYGKGYDHNWVISRAPVVAPRLVARVTEPISGRVMEIISNQPGIQFYSGNFLDATVRGKSGHMYRQGDGIVLEPQLFPDTPNQPDFGSARLEPGDTYVNKITYRFSVSRE